MLEFHLMNMSLEGAGMLRGSDDYEICRYETFEKKLSLFFFRYAKTFLLTNFMVKTKRSRKLGYTLLISAHGLGGTYISFHALWDMCSETEMGACSYCRVSVLFYPPVCIMFVLSV